MFFKYETHLHTSPASNCARVGVRETLEFYKELGYDGVFLTNHFYIDGHGSEDRDALIEAVRRNRSDYDEGARIGDEIGLKVFYGVEITYYGSDFLVYGLDYEWFLNHPEILDMKKTEQLPYFMENGALVIHAHPFREARYIDHIRLYPRSVHGVEIINGCRTDFENEMATNYARSYGLISFAGSDNHTGRGQMTNIGLMAGMCSEKEINSVKEFIEAVMSGEMRPFYDRYKKETDE